MASVKGNYTFPAGDVKVRFTIHLLCDEADLMATRILQHVGGEVWHFARERSYEFQDILDNRDLIERIVLKSQVVSHQESGFLGIRYTLSPVSQFVSKIDFEFTEVTENISRSEVVVLSPPPEPAARDVVNLEKPEPPKKTVAEKVTERIGEKADRLVSVSKAAEELLKRYAPEMERDPELAKALNNLVDAEKNNVFDP